MTDAEYELELHELAHDRYTTRLAREARLEQAQAESDAPELRGSASGSSVVNSGGRSLKEQ